MILKRGVDESEGIIGKLTECKWKIASAMSTSVSTSTISSDLITATIKPPVNPWLPKLILANIEV